MSNKEIELIEFLNKKLDVLNDFSNQFKVVILNDVSLFKDNYIVYVEGYKNCIKDVKCILLKLLKGETIIYDEKESS